MNTVLVVDDSVMDRRRAGALIERGDGWQVTYAEDGPQALARLATDNPAVVVTDLTMPGMTGLELVEAIHQTHPHLPVIIMTSMGSEDVAVEALKAGAASYVPKRRLAHDLLGTILSVSTAARGARPSLDIRDCLEELSICHVVPPNLGKLLAVAQTLQGHLSDAWALPMRELIQPGIALEEALSNAFYHGCLEAPSSLRDSDFARYQALVAERQARAPYQDRTVRIEARITRQRATFVITDEGVGFETRLVPNPARPETLENAPGRGLVLIQTFMDSVAHNPAGNEITLVKYRPRRRSGPAPASPALVHSHPEA